MDHSSDASGDRGRHGLGSRAQRGARLAGMSASRGASYAASRVRGLRDRGAADDRFHAETAQQLLEVLGSMKGAAMKIGQIASFVDLDLPEEIQATYHQVLGDLRDSAPAHDPEQIRALMTSEYGAPPEQVFASWDPEPLASASIGQVHRARLHDGTDVVTKVQYPGVAEAVESDLANVETFAPLARVISPNLQMRELLAEVHARVSDELDYQREAQYQHAFYERYAAHPFIRVPAVHHAYCRPRVLVSDYVTGLRFDEMVATADEEERQRYGEILFRFVFGSIFRFRLFNADPHPGNYLFGADGTVTFLDFGSVKPFSSRARSTMRAQLQAASAGDAAGLRELMTDAGFIPRGRPVDTDGLLAWMRLFNRPVLEDAPYRYTQAYASEVIRASTDPRLGYVDVLRKLNLPAEYLLLNRIMFGVNSILGRLGADANWHRICLEFWGEGEPSTRLGELEAPYIARSAMLA